MKEIVLEQGTPAWLAWREGAAFDDLNGVHHQALNGPRITATAASVCGGRSPFATPHELWGEMMGYRRRQTATFAMQRGTDLEPKARKAYTEIVGEDYEAICVESSQTPWIAASLDGVDLLRTRGVEIKCPMSARVHDMAMLGEVPPYYFDQIQWQLLATDNQLKEIDYYSFAPQIGVASPITVAVDLARQAELLEAAQKLRLAVMTRVPLSGSEFEIAAKAFLVLNRRYKAIEDELNAAKERVKELAGGKPTQGGGVMVTVSNGEGRTSWEKVALELIAKLGLPENEVDAMKAAHKGKPTSTISVKEAADAEAIFQEIVSVQWSETSTVARSLEAVDQPLPIW
ncbi:MAG: lambda-exonuclease family protein [Limnohabitans sp.]|uniref:lambda-exonuclease family protein n=1 Tax=Limnohabitans sp. TaxID=1907725 RepID=UPI003918FB7A